MDRLILGLVVGAALGVGGGLLVSSLLESETTVLEPSSPAGADGGAGARSEDGVRQPARTNEERESAGDEAALRDDLARTIRAIPVAPVATGDLTIDGRVVDGKGEPIAGVEILAESTEYWRTRIGDANEDPHRPVEEIVAETVKRLRWTRATRRVAETDGDGVFRLDGLAAGRYRILPRMDGYDFISDGREQLQSVRAPASLDLVGEAVSGVVLDIRLPDGSRPGYARVELEGDQRSWKPWTPIKPRFEIRPGVYTVTVTAEENRFKAEPFEVTVLERAPDTTLDVRLVGRPSIHGRIRLPPGESRDFIQVRAVSAEGNRLPEPAMFMSSAHADWAHGRRRFAFEITDLEDGRYAVAAVDDGHIVSDVVFVDVSGGVAECELRMKELDASEFLVIHAWAPDGTRSKSIEASLRVEYDGGSSSGGGGRTVRRADGSFWVPFDRESKNYANASYAVTVTNEKYGSVTVDFARSDRSEVTVNFTEPAMLEVVLAGYVGSRLEGRVSVSTRSPDGPRGWRGRNENAVEPGKWRFGPVQTGELVVSVTAAESRSRDLLLSETVVIKPGRNEVTLPLPAVYDFVVLVPGEKAGVGVHLTPVDGGDLESRRRARTEVDGRARFELVPAGRYRVQVNKGLPLTMVIDVPCGDEVVFEGRAPDCLQVAVNDENGALARAGFADGDLVIGIDGEEFDTSEKLMMSMMKIRTAESVDMMVLRGRKRLTLTVEPSTVFGGRGAGGSIMPSTR